MVINTEELQELNINLEKLLDEKYQIIKEQKLEILKLKQHIEDQLNEINKLKNLCIAQRDKLYKWEKDLTEMRGPKKPAPIKYQLDKKEVLQILNTIYKIQKNATNNT